ncbi:hypothetical protein CEXT_32671 [Caerostris extrusa]|uniref:Uncharacterized protein n=1 Tax=Caerostris extrusa TaxID=172846 RepID=A0AAV4SII4_CAEEX|nr:hypothetical protein CEXT_32671 [Caerostris extrusa]
MCKAYDTYITLGEKKSAVRGEIETRKRISFICEPRTLVQACREKKGEGIALVFREVVAGDNAVIDYRLFELSALFFRPSFFFEGFEHQNWTLKRPVSSPPCLPHPLQIMVGGVVGISVSGILSTRDLLSPELFDV